MNKENMNFLLFFLLTLFLCFPVYSDEIFTVNGGSLYWEALGGSANIGPQAKYATITLDQQGQFGSINEEFRTDPNDHWGGIKINTISNTQASANKSSDTLIFGSTLTAQKYYDNYFHNFQGFGALWHNPRAAAKIVYRLNFTVNKRAVLALLSTHELMRQETGALFPGIITDGYTSNPLIFYHSYTSSYKEMETSIQSIATLKYLDDSSTKTLFDITSDYNLSNKSDYPNSSLTDNIDIEKHSLLERGNYYLEISSEILADNYANIAFDAGEVLYDSGGYGSQIGTAVGIPAETNSSLTNSLFFTFTENPLTAEQKKKHLEKYEVFVWASTVVNAVSIFTIVQAKLSQQIMAGLTGMSTGLLDSIGSPAYSSQLVNVFLTSAFLVGAVPAGVLTAKAALVAGALTAATIAVTTAIDAQADNHFELANDPPDYNYEELAQYSSDTINVDYGSVIDNDIEQIYNDIFIASQALNNQLISIERFQGAMLSDEPLWAQKQLDAYNKFKKDYEIYTQRASNKLLAIPSTLKNLGMKDLSIGDKKFSDLFLTLGNALAGKRYTPNKTSKSIQVILPIILQ